MSAVNPSRNRPGDAAKRDAEPSYQSDRTTRDNLAELREDIQRCLRYYETISIDPEQVAQWLIRLLNVTIQHMDDDPR